MTLEEKLFKTMDVIDELKNIPSYFIDYAEAE